MLTIALQDGFEGEAVTVRVDGETVIDETSVRTDQRIGLAHAVDVPHAEAVARLEVRVPGRNLRATAHVDARTTPFVAISVLDGEVVVTTSAAPFGYA
ncbi:MAG TPA: hypothetical protein VK891_14830 [Euzebyales bacterium]|nr:hypothetical protein [Euzebyales bacterium]